MYPGSGGTIPTRLKNCRLGSNASTQPNKKRIVRIISFALGIAPESRVHVKVFVPKRYHKLSNRSKAVMLVWFFRRVKVNGMQGSRTEAIRTKIQPSKPKRHITRNKYSQNTKKTYGQPSEQLFPKRCPLSNTNRTKHYMNTRKVKRHRNTDTKNRQKRTTIELPPWNGQQWITGGVN